MTAPALEVRVQAWEELLEARGGGPFATRRELLALAQERFSDGETLYSVRTDGRLAHLGWRAAGSGGALAKELRARAVLAEKSVLLHGFDDLGKRSGTAAFEACLRRMLLDGAEAGETETVLCLDAGERERVAVAERLGFRRDAVAVKSRVLGRAWSWSLEVGEVR